MRVLLLTDIHGNVEKLQRIFYREEFDTALCAGDLSDASKFDNYTKRLKKVLKVFDKEGKLSKMVPGNMDKEQECIKQLIDHRMNLHKNIASFEKFDALGYGGGNTPFDTPFEPDQEKVRETLEILHGRTESDTKIGVIHHPPYNTAADIADGNHVGSKPVRKLVEEKDFNLILTGHIHESRAKDKIGSTEIINPGPVNQGYYAVAEIGDEIETKMKSL